MSIENINLIHGRSCRACLNSQNTSYVLLDEGGTWTALFEFCLNITLSFQQSSIMCQKCANEIEKYAEFKKQCLESDSVWRSVIDKGNGVIMNLCSNELRQGEVKTEVYDSIVPDDLSRWDDQTCYFEMPLQNEVEFDYKMKPPSKENSIRIPSQIDNKIGHEKSDVAKENYKIKDKIKTDICKNAKNDNDVTNLVKECKKDWTKQIKYYHKMATHRKQKNVRTELPKSGVFYCGLCELSSPNYDTVKKHLELHSCGNHLICKLCEYAGRDFADMESHRFSHHPKEFKVDHICHVCDKKFWTPMSLQFHYRSVHLNKKGGLCTVCNKAYSNFKQWKNHETLHRVTKYFCDHCGRNFMYKSQIKAHLIDHSDMKKYICETCGKGFKRNSNLKSHIQNVHVVKTPIKCSHCDKVFKGLETYRHHMKLINTEKNFFCTNCPKGFPSSIMLEKHMFWHTGERPHVCVTCRAKYKTKSQLKVHMRNHTGIFPHKCTSCEKSFATTSQLRVHQSVHTGVRRHKCSHCERSFNGKKNLVQHCALIHKDLVGSDCSYNKDQLTSR